MVKQSKLCLSLGHLFYGFKVLEVISYGVANYVPKQPKNVTSKYKHKRVRSDIIDASKNIELMSEHLYHQMNVKVPKKVKFHQIFSPNNILIKPEAAKQTETLKHSSSSKKLLKNISKASNSNKMTPASFTTRIVNTSNKSSRGNYMSQSSTVKSPHKNYKVLNKKSLHSSSQTSNKGQHSMITDKSGRPPATFKKLKTPGHTKNSLSTHIKPQKAGDEMDEFPAPGHYRKATITNEFNKENEEDSSIIKYKQYKQQMHQKSENKEENKTNYVSEQNKYTKLLNSHFNKGILTMTSRHLNQVYLIAAANKGSIKRKKNKSDYFNEHVQPNKKQPGVYKFDMISDEFKSAYQKSESDH